MTSLNEYPIPALRHPPGNPFDAGDAEEDEVDRERERRGWLTLESAAAAWLYGNLGYSSELVGIILRRTGPAVIGRLNTDGFPVRSKGSKADVEVEDLAEILLDQLDDLGRPFPRDVFARDVMAGPPADYSQSSPGYVVIDGKSYPVVSGPTSTLG